jgi:hypothetical protein
VASFEAPGESVPGTAAMGKTEPQPAEEETFADATPPPDPVAAEMDAQVGHAADVAVRVDMVEHIAQRVIAQISDRVIREIAWEVIPDLAETIIKKEIERLKAELARL